MPGLRTLRRIALSFCGALALALTLARGNAIAADPPLSDEFGTPFQMRLVADRTILEVYGSFSPALAPDFETVIAQERDLRVVRLESPGGNVGAAVRVAAAIRKRGLATYVGNRCASACTLAFLGGRQRWVAPDARVGFHQAHSEKGGASEPGNRALRQAYESVGMPQDFIAHVLATPPTEIWVPSQAELRAMHVTTADPPDAVLALRSAETPNLNSARALLKTAPDEALIRFAAAFTVAVARLQENNPEACWTFAHGGKGNELSTLPQADLDAIAAAMKHLAEAAKYQQVPPLDPDQRQKATRDLFAAMRANGQGAVLEGLRPNAAHAAFCPALRAMLQAALAGAGEHRSAGLRALLAGG